MKKLIFLLFINILGLNGCAGLASVFEAGKENSSIIGSTGLWISIGLNPEDALGGVPLPSLKFGYGTVWRVGKHDDVTILVNGSAASDSQETKANNPTLSGNASLFIRAKNDKEKPAVAKPSTMKEVQ